MSSKTMAKRAAAGTLALAVCLTGGAVAFAGAANAAIAPNTGTSTATGTAPSVTTDQPAQSVGDLTFTMSAAETYSANEKFTFAAPTGFTFSGPLNVAGTYTNANENGAPTATAAITQAGDTVTVTLGTASTAAQAESFVLTGLKATVAAGTANGATSAAITGLPGVASVPLATVQSVSGIETATPLPTLTRGTTGNASPVVIKSTGAAWSAGDTLRLSLPAGYTFASAPTAAVVAAAAKANVNVQLRAVQQTGDVSQYDLIFVDAIGTGSGTPAVTSSDVTVALSNLSVKASGTAAAGPVVLGIAKGKTTTPGDISGTPNANFFIGVSPTVAIASGTALSVTVPSQTLVKNAGPQLFGALRISEVASSNTGLVDGDYTFTFSNATVSDPQASGFKATVTGPDRLGTSTIAASGSGHTAVTVHIAGTSTLASDYFEVAGLYLSPTGGNVKVTVTGPGGVVVPDSTIAVSATATRIGGLDRYATAAQIATALQGTDLNATTENQPTRVDNIILSQGGFQTAGGQAPDALAANYLAGRLTVAGTGAFDATAGITASNETATSKVAPILLTDKASVPSATIQAMTSAFAISSTATNAYASKTITITGGEAAVSADVVTQLKAAFPGIKVVRVDGADRYATAAAIVLNQQGEPVRYSPTYNTAKLPTAIVASGENGADALSAGAITAETNIPLLLTAKGDLPKATKDALSAKGIGRVLLMGGTSAVSADVEAQLKALNIDVIRVAGADRYETSALLLALAKTAGPTSTTTTGGLGLSAFDSDTVYLANGDTFADALTTGPLSAAQNRNVVLTSASSLPDISGAFIKASSASSVIGIGLESAVPSSVLDKAKSFANGSAN